tara:strand:- start:1801 stop:2301 length:501 start_codon:yes stop_codon:yes gene_type:complete
MSAANITGWGRSTWGAGAWSNPVPVEVTGLAGTTALNNATIVTTQQIQFTVTGSAGTGAVGSVVAGAGASVSEDGLVATVSFGDESVVGTALVSATGAAGTTAVGTASVATITAFEVSSPEMVSFVGNVSIPVDTVGLSATGNIGNVTIWQEVVPSTTTNWIEVAA